MKALRILILLAIVLLACATAAAGIRPSFLPEVCSWRATDIVIVTEGKEIDGVFTILETLKGGLKPEATIRIPELAEFKTKQARAVNAWLGQKLPAGEPEFVTGEKMILFLRDAEKITTDSDDDDEYLKNRAKANPARWQPANIMGDEPQYSTVWIEKGEVYCFIQQMNPGPSLLCKSGYTETALRNEISDVRATQEALTGAIAIADPGLRALSLKPFLHHRVYLAHEKAFSEITKCDEAALPVLRKVLDDESLIAIHSDAIDALEAVGGKKIGPELTLLVERETEFWRKRAPSLKPAWRNEFDPNGDSALLANPWAALQQALVSLQDIRYAGAEKEVTEFKRLMQSLPQIFDRETSQLCDAMLRAVPRKAELEIPHYEIRFTGNKAFSTAALEKRFAESLSDYQHLQKPYQGDIFSYALDRIGNFISSQGYAATGSSPQLADSKSDSESVAWSEFRASDHQDAAIGTNERGVVITVQISEGNRYRLGAVRIEGARVFNPEQLRAMLSVQEGEFCDFVMINNWLYEDLEKAYKNRGYLQVSVEDDSSLRPPAHGADAGIANFKVKIAEGQLFKVKLLAFEGNSDISAARLRSALKLAEGALYSEDNLDASIDALNELGLDIDKETDVRTTEDEEHGLVSIVFMIDKRTSRQSSGRAQLGRRIRRIFH